MNFFVSHKGNKKTCPDAGYGEIAQLSFLFFCCYQKKKNIITLALICIAQKIFPFLPAHFLEVQKHRNFVSTLINFQKGIYIIA